MALFIKRKSDGAEFADKTHVYGGGIVCAFEVSTNVYCPIIVYDDAVSISGDKLEVQTPKPISELYWAYSDTFVADPTINPNLTGSLAYPILLSTNPDKYYTTANNPTSTTTFKILLDNPNNWQVQFSTNVEGTGGVAGGVDSGGYPVGWANISKETAGHYLVRTISHNTLQQTVWIRYRRTGDTGYPTDPIYRIGPNFTPMPIFGNGGSGGGGGGTPIGGTNAVSPPFGANGGVPLLAHVWGMMGNEGIVAQGTYQDDILAIENLAKVSGIGDEAFKCLPWYAVRNASPTQYQTSVWNAGADTGNKRTSEIYYSFALTKPIMKLYVEYAVRAGIQGFMMLNYGNDAYLSLFRRVFRTLDYATEMRGVKICYSLDFGGGGRETYATDILDDNIHTPYKDTVYQFAEDIVQPWYATARKMVGSGGAAMQVPIVHLLVTQAGAPMDERKEIAWEDLARIKARVLVNRPGNPLGETFNILMTSQPDISAGSADGTGNTWNATTSYYLQPSGAFSDAGTMLDTSLGSSGVNAANKVPMVSWGYDSRPRWYFQHGDVPSYFNYDSAVVPYMPTLLEKLKVHMNDAPKDLRVALCGQVGEYAEQGRDLFPSFVVGSAPSTTMLDIFKAKFNSGYVIPT